jgi:hypothetical protein
VLCALTPPGKVAQGRVTWWFSVTNFTLGGLLASAATGALLAIGGRSLGLGAGTSTGVVAAVAVGVVAAARELGLRRIPLVQARRATRDAWARRWGHRRAALLWGVDIGLFFTTWLTFAGAWFVVALAVASADIPFACGLFAAYWLGRAATVWIGRWLVPDATSTPRLALAWQRLHGPFRLLHVVTVALGLVLLLASEARSEPVRVGCAQASEGHFRNAYDRTDNIVVGPLSLVGAGRLAQEASEAELRRAGGYKIPLLLRPGRSALISIDRRDRDIARLSYREVRYGRPAFASLPAVMRFESCDPGHGPRSVADGMAVTFWSGFVVLHRSPACVRTSIAIDGGRARVRTLRFGTRRCS